MRSVLIDHPGAIAGRMACILVAALLTCASTAHGQVIEEGAFPVKGGGISGESFSLSCLPRLVAQAGQSLLLSCTVRGVPEEGVRYEWKSVLGEGLSLLSDAQSYSPFFTAPLSGAGEEYAYRLTAMAAGVYRAATVTVSVEGASGEPVRAPGLQEECDPFTIPDEPGQGCAPWEREPDPFGFGPESEGGFLFPEAPSLPVRGGGSDLQAPPRLECPVAVFLEELETGAIECHAWDASGEEYLEYTWEPVGSTTRDYLDNPRLIPEDSPTPSVIAPEAPVYETLEPFRSGETTFRYRYRLTATSRATGLSSSSEVEVYVSSSRPSVYCLLEIVVEEGETVTLDCEGADPLSFRMGYDEEAASVLWEWEGLWGTSTAPLDATDLSSPLFTAPAGSAGEEYHYIASMTTSASGAPRTARRRVTVRVAGEEGVSGRMDGPYIDCQEDAFEVYEGEGLIVHCQRKYNIPQYYIDAEMTNKSVDSSPDIGFEWTGDGSHGINVYLYLKHKLAWFPWNNVRFAPPVDENTDYEYTIRICPPEFERTENHFCPAGDAVASDVFTVTVLDGARPAVACNDPAPVYEGAEDFTLDCSPTNEPSGATYSWTGTDIANRLRGTDTLTPTFYVPDSVASNTVYDYTITMSVDGSEQAADDVSITVLDKASVGLSCTDPNPVYEGSDDIVLDCSVTGNPPRATYTWSPLDSPSDTERLSATTVLSPTFYVPDNVDSETEYSYRVVLTFGGGNNVLSLSAEITVTVKDRPDITVACEGSPYDVDEGDSDIELECEASGAPEEAAYTWSWSPTARLTGYDTSTPIFSVPSSVDSNTNYRYSVTATAANAGRGVADVVVRVHDADKPVPVVSCIDSEVYEGSSDFSLDCTVRNEPSGATYSWSGADIANRLRGTDALTPTFLVPDEVGTEMDYAYTVTLSASGIDDVTEEVTVTVLNKEALAVVCLDPGSVYEGSADIAFDCEASGAPGDSPGYTYVWAARGDTPDVSLLSAADIALPTFYVPDEVDATTTYEYRLTVSAENAEDGTAEVTVTVLNHGPLAVVCTDPGSVYEGSADIAFDCEASGAPGDSPGYTYVWAARGDTPDVSLLSAADIALPTFYVPDEVDATTTYEYRLTVSAENAEDGTAEVTVTVLNKEALAVTCADPGSVYEGSEDIAFDCSASGAPEGSSYTYAWTARGDTPDTALLSATDIASLAFYVPNEVDATTTYEYRLTVSAENAEDASAEVAVTVLNKEALAVVCANPGSVYEGSEDITFDCSASGAPEGSSYTYAWTARGDTPDTALLSATDIASLAFYVPNEVDATTTYEYRLTVSAENAEDGTAEVTVTVLNKEALAVTCAAPGSVYEGSEDITFDCSASGAPEGSSYTYAWTARGDTPDTALLSATDIASLAFYVPNEVDATTTYEYLLTVSAENAEDASAEVAVTVLDRIQTPDPDPVSSALASSSARELSESSSLGVTVSASLLRFGVQSADTQVSLDPVTDQLSTHVSGPYHAGRMTLAPGGEALDENREMDLSIELTSPVLLKRADAVETSSLVLEPAWSLAESCEQLSSQAIGGLYMEVTLSEEACRLLRFGGELDLTDIPSGQYAGNMDIILRSGEREETFAVEVSVTVVPAQRVITIGPGGVRFSTSRELPVSLTEEQNLSIYPDVAFLTEKQPHGVFELSNPSLIPLEVSVLARFGYTEATANGREVVVEDVSASRLSDLSEVVDIHPGVLVLQPGEKGLIRYGVKEEAHAEMAQKGYAAFFDVVSAPRQYVALDRMPEEVTGDRTARVTMRVPGVYVPGEGASQLRAALLSISYVGSLSATFLLETADHPFVGEVVAYDGDGRELGRREALVYTRSRVRVPLDGTPDEETVFLRFVPRRSDRAPLPTSVEWNAPRRDIGDAEDKDRATIPATLVQKQ